MPRAPTRATDAAWTWRGSSNLAKAVHGDLQPDCTLLLDLPVEVGLTRARGRSGVAADRFEAEAAEFFERVRQGYLQIARAEPKRVRVIDAAAALPSVTQQVTAVLESL